MRRGTWTWWPMLAVLLLLPLMASADVVVPGLSITTEGNYYDVVPWTCGPGVTFQQVHAASEFAGPVQIEGMAFRPDWIVGNRSAFSQTFTSAVITFSTTSAAVDSLSTTFASNEGADLTTVYSGGLTISSSFLIGGLGTTAFDIVIPFSTPFIYDPADGNLLYTVRLTGGSTLSSPVDAVNSTSDTVSTIRHDTSATSTTGYSRTFGNVTKFLTNELRVTCPADTTAECGVAKTLTFGIYDAQAGTITVRIYVDGSLEQTTTISATSPPVMDSVSFTETYTTGVRTVRCTAVNASTGYTAECEVDVTTTDTVAPVITLNGSASMWVECGQGFYSEPGATALDGCEGLVSVTISGDTVNPYSCGTYTIYYDAEDPAGNDATTLTRTVIVRDTEAPTIFLNGASSDYLECGVDTYSEAGAYAFDECDGVFDTTIGGDVVDPNTCGVYWITYDAKDTCGANGGNVATQVQRRIEVVDTRRPEIYLNGSSFITLECGQQSYTEEGAWADDDCDSDVEVTVGGDTVDPDTCGEYVVTYDAVDECGGNAATQAWRTVLVRDRTPPQIILNGSDPVRIECGEDTYTELGASASDACDPDVEVEVGGDTVYTDRCGEYRVSYDAQGDCDETPAPTEYRTVIVEDTTPPVITLQGQADVTLECGVDSWDDPGASAEDSCDGPLPVSVSGDIVNTYECGDYVIRYDARDECGGNDAVQVTRTVRVEDTRAPEVELVGPATMTLECGVDSYSEPGAYATDECDSGIQSRLVIGGDTVNTESCGRYVVTYTARDECGGNTTVEERVVTVDDTRPPVISLSGASLIYIECGVDTYTEPGATVTDECDANIQDALVIGGDTVDEATCGEYTLTYDAEDECGGNAAEQLTRTVIVRDTIPPVIEVDGADPLVLECGVDDYTEYGATVTDECDQDIQDKLVIDASEVDTTVCGTYTVYYDATDECGDNPAEQQTRTVVVEDTIAPSVAVSVQRALLWPPRWGMFPVAMAYQVTDECDDDPSIRVKVYSDEGHGAEPFAPDASVDATSGMRLRAERAWPGNGRVYLIVVEATDYCGPNTGYGCISVVVPSSPTVPGLTTVRTQAATAEAVVNASGYAGAVPSGFTLLYDSGATSP